MPEPRPAGTRMLPSVYRSILLLFLKRLTDYRMECFERWCSRRVGPCLEAHGDQSGNFSRLPLGTGSDPWSCTFPVSDANREAQTYAYYVMCKQRGDVVETGHGELGERAHNMNAATVRALGGSNPSCPIRQANALAHFRLGARALMCALSTTGTGSKMS